jgi:hypothetical protein
VVSLGGGYCRPIDATVQAHADVFVDMRSVYHEIEEEKSANLASQVQSRQSRTPAHEPTGTGTSVLDFLDDEDDDD